MYVFFEWDEHKAALNVIKHGVSFDLLQQLFQTRMRA